MHCTVQRPVRRQENETKKDEGGTLEAFYFAQTTESREAMEGVLAADVP